MSMRKCVITVVLLSIVMMAPTLCNGGTKVEKVAEEVGVGEYKTYDSSSKKKIVPVSVDCLFDSVALAVLYNKDKKTGIYRYRAFFHISGGNLECAYFGSQSCGYNIDATGDIEPLTKEIKKASDGLVVIAFGVSNATPEGKLMFLSQRGMARKPKPLINLLDAAKEIVIGDSSLLVVQPNGKAVFSRWGLVIDPIEKDKVQDLIKRSRSW